MRRIDGETSTATDLQSEGRSPCPHIRIPDEGGKENAYREAKEWQDGPGDTWDIILAPSCTLPQVTC